MTLLESLGFKCASPSKKTLVPTTLLAETPVAPTEVANGGMGMGMTELPVSDVSMPIPRSLFNEATYLANNPDVAALVATGEMTAFEHYFTTGHAEELARLRRRSLPAQSPTINLRPAADDDLVERLIEAEIEKRALMEAWDRELHRIPKVTFDMVSEEVDEAVRPPLDRADCDETNLDEDQRFWRDNGYVIKPGFIPEEMVDRYAALRARHPDKGGWGCPVPYMHVSELSDISLYPPLMQLMHRLVGEEMMLHLNLTGWVSTDRNWHQDDYLNPPYINSWYAATWVALDDIHPDCGPFEFVPGSHKWPLMKGHKVRMYLTPEERNSVGWPSLAERFVNDLAQDEIDRRGVEPKRFIARKGDVLIWHGRLMHRGSYAKQPGMERRTLISHYSGVSHRVDMKEIGRTPEGSAYFDHMIPLGWSPYA